MWLQEHPDADLERVPADMVMASGSGLDPDITLDNALWQLDRVAAAWAKKTGATRERSRDEIEQLLREQEPCAAGRTGRRAAGERAGDQPCPTGPLRERKAFPVRADFRAGDQPGPS